MIYNGNDICPKCGVKIEGGYCECFETCNNKIVKKITVEYTNGEKEEVVQGYLISVNGNGESSCINFNV